VGAGVGQQRHASLAAGGFCCPPSEPDVPIPEHPALHVIMPGRSPRVWGCGFLGSGSGSRGPARRGRTRSRRRGSSSWGGGAHADAGVSFLEPADDPPEGEVVQIAEGAFRHAVAEVGAPTSDQRVEPAQQVGECAMRCPPSQLSHLVDDRSQGLLRRVGVDVAFPGLVTFLTAALDAPAEKVEPCVYVGQARLGLRGGVSAFV
jgi:hypothetical protein